MIKKRLKFKNICYAVLSVVLCVITVICEKVNLSAFADTADGIRAAYENTNVWDNLQNSTLGGNAFNIEDYPHKENGKPQLISLVEFCYSYYADKQSDYGLYIYVYNPQDLAFDTDTERNRIQLKYGKSAYDTYPLKFLNCSNAAGYEGRFYKFKIAFTNNQTRNILNTVEANNRVYEISGITLCIKGVATEYTSAQKYTYTGYVNGYGSELAESDTLSCTVDGFDKYIELDVKHTFYRPQGDYYNGEQSQLNTCYFRVPNKYFTDYGDLSKIVCEWFEYFTKPILVTEDNYTYNKINSLHGADTENLSDDMYFLFNVFWENAQSSWFKKSGICDWTSNYGYEVGDTYRWGFLWLNGTEVVYEDFANFAAVFYTGGKPCEDYEIAGEVLKQKILSNSSYLGGEMLNDRYSKYLFEDYVQNGYEYGYNRKEINADDMQEVFWNITTKNLWQTIFSGGFDVETIYDSKKAIEKVTSNDLTGSDSEIAGSLYINENDVSNLKAECQKAETNDETVVLLRYSTTQYMCAPCTSTYCSNDKVDGGKTLVKTNCENWGNNEFNAYVAQETVYLDFDIISLWFTADGVETEIPVVHNPTDIISGVTPPLEEDYHNEKSRNIFLMIIALIAVILIFVLFYPILSPILGAIVKGLLWLITAPFKAIGNAVKRRKLKQPKSSELNGNVSPEEVNAYLDSIDWDSVDWSKLDGKSG